MSATRIRETGESGESAVDQELAAVTHASAAVGQRCSSARRRTKPRLRR
jgi:hypothetical protein